MDKKLIILASLILAFSSCTKDVPPELSNKNQKTVEKQTKQEMPDDSIHRNLMKGHPESLNGENSKENQSSGESEIQTDETANSLIKEADEADLEYTKSKSGQNRKLCIEKQMKAANFLMFEADLPPKDKYKPALKRYRRVLELEPDNKEALANKNQIEEIYRAMGRPVPN